MICRSLCATHFSTQREPIGLYSTQTRPDGLTLVPLRQGSCIVWDSTVVDTLAPSHVQQTALSAGAAADAMEELKRHKYAGRLSPAYEFVPLGFETLGAMGRSTRDMVDFLGKRLVAATGNLRAGEYLLQRLSLALLRGNVGSILGSVRQTDDTTFGGDLVCGGPSAVGNLWL